MVLRVLVLLLALVAPAAHADLDDPGSSRFRRLRDIDDGVQSDAGDDDDTKGLYGGDEDLAPDDDPFADEEATEPEAPSRAPAPTPSPARRPLGAPRPSEAAPKQDRAGGGAATTDTPAPTRGRPGVLTPPTDPPRDDDAGPDVPIRGGRGGTQPGD